MRGIIVLKPRFYGIQYNFFSIKGVFIIYVRGGGAGKIRGGLVTFVSLGRGGVCNFF